MGKIYAKTVRKSLSNFSRIKLSAMPNKTLSQQAALRIKDISYFLGTSQEEFANRIFRKNDEIDDIGAMAVKTFQKKIDEHASGYDDLSSVPTPPNLPAGTPGPLAETSLVILIPQNDRYAKKDSGSGQLTLQRINFKERFKKDHNGAAPEPTQMFYKGTRSGILVHETKDDGSKPKAILTAGHRLKVGDTFYAIRKFTYTNYGNTNSVQRAEYVECKVGFAVNGNAHEEDWAVLSITPENDWDDIGLNVSNYLASASEKAKVTVFGHPLGMVSWMDEKGVVLKVPGKHWDNDPIQFTSLDTANGSSGSPVFWRNADEAYKLVGMVLGSGGLPDFEPVKDAETLQWVNRLSKNSIGTRMLNLSRIQVSLSNYLKFKTLPSYPTPNPTCATAQLVNFPFTLCLEDYDVWVRDSTFYIREKKNANPVTIPLSLFNSPITVFLNGKNLTIYNSPLSSIEQLRTELERLPVLETLWLEKFNIEPNDCLRFNRKEAQITINQFPLETERAYYFLDGIGTADIVDELPDMSDYLKRQIWLCDKEYIEFLAIKISDFSEIDYDERAIRVRTISGNVPIYLRTLTRT